MNTLKSRLMMIYFIPKIKIGSKEKEALMKVYEKTTFHNQTKFITDDHLQLFKTLQLFTNHLHEIQIFTNAIVIKKSHLIIIWVDQKCLWGWA